MSKQETNAEMVEIMRQMVLGREMLSAALLGALRVLARDVLAVANVAPGDPLRAAIVRNAKQRAERVIRDIGDDEHSH